MKIFIQFLTVIAFVFATKLTLLAHPALDKSFIRTGFKLTKLEHISVGDGKCTSAPPNYSIASKSNNCGIDKGQFINCAKSNQTYEKTFSTGGKVIIAGRSVVDMALLSSGKLIVASSGIGPTGASNFTVLRFNKNGALDTNFGNAGEATISIPNVNMTCTDVTLQEDGKIVLAGYSGYEDGLGDLIIVRLNKNGNPDNTFASNGMFRYFFSGNHSAINQICIQPDGKIVGGGYVATLVQFEVLHYDLLALRLNINGTLDHTFGSEGIARIDNGGEENSNAIALLSDNRIVLGGDSNGKFTALCLMPNGSKDMSFGTEGWKYVNINGGSTDYIPLTAAQDDDIILADQSLNTIPLATAKSAPLVKLNSTGVLNNTFGNGSIDASLPAINLSGVRDFALHADGKILMKGFWYSGGIYCSIFTAGYHNTLIKEVSLTSEQQKLFTYPDPIIENSFNINNELSEPSQVKLLVFDINGKIIYDIDYGSNKTGSYSNVVTLPKNISGEMYYVQLNLDGVLIAQKIIVVK